ncbi:hypothetical protein HK100_011834 [Physocladia obscura]|uniref:Uncharacterized protein n=1 Tax=Physocladia obscura TaxID=109957 RepID=A0AAD5XK50_9FUNG|nr:hypothetical protein HK100_011834 [Physocladia obscura]
MSSITQASNGSKQEESINQAEELRQQSNGIVTPSVCETATLPTVWIVRQTGNSGRATLAVAAETNAINESETLQLLQTQQHRLPSASRIPRSLGMSDIAQYSDQQPQSHANKAGPEINMQLLSSATRVRGNINEINKRWDEMMKCSTSTTAKSSTPVIDSTQQTPPITSQMENIPVPTHNNIKSPVVFAINHSNSADQRSEKKTKKSISFSENVMYRSLSSINIDISSNDQLNALKMGIYDIWSDEEDFRDEEDDTVTKKKVFCRFLNNLQLYSDESNEWAKDDYEFSAIIDGTNVMPLPLDDEDDINPSYQVPHIPVEIRDQQTVPSQALAIALSNLISTEVVANNDCLAVNAELNRNSVSSSPTHSRFRKNQNNSSNSISHENSSQLIPQANKSKLEMISPLILPKTVTEQIINLELPENCSLEHLTKLKSESVASVVQKPPIFSDSSSLVKISPPSTLISPPQLAIKPRNSQILQQSSTVSLTSFQRQLNNSAQAKLAVREFNQSPTFLRDGSGSSNISKYLTKSELKSIDIGHGTKVSTAEIEKYIESTGHNINRSSNINSGNMAMSSSPWIKRASKNNGSKGNEISENSSKKLNKISDLVMLKSLQDGDTDDYDEKKRNSTDVTELRNKNFSDDHLSDPKIIKKIDSSDSLVLDEEEIALDVIKPDGDISATAFFIPLENTKIEKKDDLSVENDNGQISKPVISNVDPLVVIVSPQTPKIASNTRTSSDAWINEKIDTLSANKTESLKSAKLPITKSNPKKSVSSETNSCDKSIIPLKFNKLSSSEADVPIMVVKSMALQTLQNSPPKIRLSKATHRSPENYYALSAPRDSNVTLVGESSDSIGGLRRTMEPSAFRDRILAKQFSNAEFQTLAYSKEAAIEYDKNYRSRSHTYSTGKYGYVPMPATKDCGFVSTPVASQGEAIARNFDQSVNILARQRCPQNFHSSLRYSSSPYSYRCIPDQHSFLYTPGNIQKWMSGQALDFQHQKSAYSSSLTSNNEFSSYSNGLIYNSDKSPLRRKLNRSFSTQNQRTPSVVTVSLKQNQKGFKNERISVITSSSSTKLRPFRNFITAPPNSVNSSRATTPLAATVSNGSTSTEQRKHYRRISFGSTTSSIRSSVRGIHHGYKNGSTVFDDDDCIPSTINTVGISGANEYGINLTGRIHSIESNLEVEKRSFQCYRFHSKGLIRQNLQMRGSRKIGVDDSGEVVKVVELLDGAPIDDELEIIEGKRSYPSLPRHEQESDKNLKKSGRNTKNRGKHFPGPLGSWFLRLWEKIFLCVFKK